MPISSIKSMIGHTNGAASAIEAVACALALAAQGGAANRRTWSNPDPEFGLDFVPPGAAAERVDTCLNLARRVRRLQRVHSCFKKVA